MSRSPRVIRVLSDGRSGHENQSVGLALAIARRAGSVVETVQIPVEGWLPRRCRAAGAMNEVAPDLLIGTGHKVHLPVWFAARKFHAKSVVVMKPTWPLWLFDLCILPQHDAPPKLGSGGVIRTYGALNRVPEEIPIKQPRGLVLIGGPSRNHGWSVESVMVAVDAVIKARSELAWKISDSRRTPIEFLDQVRQRNVAAEIFSHTQTPADWLPAQLIAAEEVWVTEDSVSMIFEAVTAGARTGILPAPALKASAAPVLTVRELVRSGRVTDFETWTRNGQRLPPPTPLHETGRCADIVLKRLFAAPTPFSPA